MGEFVEVSMCCSRGGIRLASLVLGALRHEGEEGRDNAAESSNERIWESYYKSPQSIKLSVRIKGKGSVLPFCHGSSSLPCSLHPATPDTCADGSAALNGRLTSRYGTRLLSVGHAD